MRGRKEAKLSLIQPKTFAQLVTILKVVKSRDGGAIIGDNRERKRSERQLGRRWSGRGIVDGWRGGSWGCGGPEADNIVRRFSLSKTFTVLTTAAARRNM